jgi:chromate transporter
VHERAETSNDPAPASRSTIAREWTRIGCIGFGGPPAHVALLRELCVVRRGWMTDLEFEDALAATNLLPGPGSTQMAIFCAWRLGGLRGALIGGLGFILPGLLVILGLSSVFLAAAPPAWIRGAGAGAGAAVAAVAFHAAIGLLGPGFRRTAGHLRLRWLAYVGVGAAASAVVGPWLVLLLLLCGAAELAWKRPPKTVRTNDAHETGPSDRLAVHAWPLLGPVVAAAIGTAGLGAVAWMAFKVGALSYGGGFVVIPLMRAEAVEHYSWMTEAQFLNAVALGQVTPGPVTHTVAVVGYVASGLGGAILAAAIAFAPSFSFILLGADRFDQLLANLRVRAFLDGAGPAAIGAIAGSAVPLALALERPWQFAVLAGAAVALLALRRGVVTTLLAAGAVGVAIGLAGGPLPPL